MEWDELKNKGPEELKEILAETRAQLHGTRVLARAGQLKQVHKISDMRKTIARISMLLKK